MITVRVDASTSYDVCISRGMLSSLGEYAKNVSKCGTACIVSDDNVFPLYGETAVKSLEDAGYRVISYVIPHGENSKSMAMYTSVLEFLLESRMTRSDILVALGGGVVGDLTGFVAATYQRGIGFIQVPTTLLAMVDSSVGGKTAVNLEHGKNQVGAFYQPLMVVCDPDTLKTLPDEEFLCGCAEVIKYAILGNAEFFDSLDKTYIGDQIEEVIKTCVEMKRDVVNRDERDTGLRMILNLGHTIGHAVEACSSFGILHGQGVAIGMASIARSAAQKGLLSSSDCEKIIALINKYRLPTEASFGKEELFEAAMADKKASGGSITVVVPVCIGKTELVKIPKEELVDWINV